MVSKISGLAQKVMVVPLRSDASCSAIRDWLDYCLDAYCTLSAARPEWFGGS